MPPILLKAPETDERPQCPYEAGTTVTLILLKKLITADMLKATGHVNDYADGDTNGSTFSGIHETAKFVTVTGYDLSAAKDWAKQNNFDFNEISPVPAKLTVKNTVFWVIQCNF